MAFQNDFRPTRPSCAGLEISEGGVWDAGGNTRNNDGKKGIKINVPQCLKHFSSVTFKIFKTFRSDILIRALR